ncbi:MAG: hypothetical protein PHI32_12555 [Dysgonamonadaceae bacterium]|nr:hypothetical protein [Dysgonamonadaceae bacterium]
MKTKSLFVFFSFLCLYIYSQTTKSYNNLILIDDYIYGNVNYYEGFERNNIYKRENVFTFSYRFVDKNGKELFFILNKGGWDFIGPNETKENIVKGFNLEVLNDNLNFKDPTFYQAGISYKYIDINRNYTWTGLIENEKNIWFHPPREHLFQILQLNPYPYIKYPLEIGHNWNWKLHIGSAWGDKRWKQWNGVVEFSYKYSIVGKKNIKSNFGYLDCFIIESEAVSELGKTKLTSFFNTKYGFVRLDYTNIDNSKLEIVLQDVTFPVFKFFWNSKY